MTDTVNPASRWRGALIGLAITAVVLGGGFLLWRVSPGYSVYRIKNALAAHDYEQLTRYVDVDQVLDHTLNELGNSRVDEGKDVPLGGFLGRLLRKEVFKLLSGEARDVAKAGLSMFIEQTVRDHNRLPPEIPTLAPIAAWWLAQRDGDTAHLTFAAKKDEPIDVTMQRTPEGVWQVVAVSNLQIFLPKLKNHLQGLAGGHANPE
jgi:hypothetical protein